MKRKAFECLLVIQLLAFPVLGQSTTTELTSELRDPSTIPAPSQPVGFENVRKASVILNMDCSGTFISNHGHILTAMHCLGPGPGMSQYFPSIGTSVQLSKMPDSSKTILGRRRNFDVRTFTATGAKLQSNGANLMGSTLVAGKGYYAEISHFASAKKDPVTYAALMDAGFGPPEDFAIIKVDLENTPCVPVQTKNSRPGDVVWSIGYPIHLDNVLGRPLWTGRGPGAFTIGKITNGFEDIPPVAEALKNNSISIDQLDIQLVKRAMNRSGSFLASTDGLSGQSGSAMISAEGKIVGVFNATESFDKDLYDGYVFGTSTGSSIENIVATAKLQLDKASFAEAFSCGVAK